MLSAADAAHAHTTGGAALTLDAWLSAASAVHAHTSDGVTMTVDAWHRRRGHATRARLRLGRERRHGALDQGAQA
ncbi:MAG TPA: hypothetical protein PKB14_10475 [Rubrivivax sp.]|nr:hypothetical protein [Rubrivivax sp.]